MKFIEMWPETVQNPTGCLQTDVWQHDLKSMAVVSTLEISTLTENCTSSELDEPLMAVQVPLDASIPTDISKNGVSF
jgi:hypothetical protein